MDADDILRRFGLRVKEMRTERGMAQTDLAAASGVNRSYLAGIETGRRNLSLYAVYRLAEGLGVSAGDLLRE